MDTITIITERGKTMEPLWAKWPTPHPICTQDMWFEAKFFFWWRTPLKPRFSNCFNISQKTRPSPCRELLPPPESFSLWASPGENLKSDLPPNPPETEVPPPFQIDEGLQPSPGPTLTAPWSTSTLLGFTPISHSVRLWIRHLGQNYVLDAFPCIQLIWQHRGF